MARSICFLSNNTKTHFFNKVSDELLNKDVKIFWIVVNEEFSNDLILKYGADHVLYLPLNIPPIGAAFDLKINDLLYADRRLKHISAKGKEYLTNIQPYIYQFLKSNSIDLVIGEQTYGYECVTFRIVDQFLKNCIGLSPYMSRYPSEHFCFYSDESFSRELFPSKPKDATDSKADIASIDVNQGQDYKAMIQLHINGTKGIKFKFDKITRFFTQDGLDKNDPTWYSNSRMDKFKKNSLHYINALTYKLVKKTDIKFLKQVVGRKVIFPLHLQPELNIDTAGRYFDHQYETIINIWRQLSPEDVLFVKEHPIAIGNRGYNFFRKLKSWPNIKVLAHECNVNELQEECDYIFTICGTMGLEAALKGKKVFCLAPTTYDRMANVASPTFDDFRCSENIDALYNQCKSRKGEWTIEQFKLHMEKYSHLGDAEGDLIGNPTSWEEKNIKVVADSFASVLDAHEQK